MFNTMADMLLDDFAFDARQRGADSGHLGHNVDAISVFLQHAHDAAHLTLDAIQAFDTSRFVVRVHIALGTPWRYAQSIPKYMPGAWLKEL